MCSNFDKIPRYLEGSALEPIIYGMLDLYQRIEFAQQRWIAASPYRCPEGCGTCCENFEPELLPAEALVLATYMLDRQPQLLDGADTDTSQGDFRPDWNSSSGCILSNPDSVYHCTVYEGRPLICRLFAFSGDKSKDGTLRYRPCKHMDVEERTTLSTGQLLERFGALPPAMGDLASEAEMLMPEALGERLPLREALRRAVDKIRYLEKLRSFSVFISGNGDDDGDNDNDNNPQPRAS